MALKILVVDDSASMRKILEMTFAGEDAKVVAVADGAAALRELDSFGPDLLFADTSMSPDGYEVTRVVKGRVPNAAAIILGSQHHPYDAAKGQASGVDDHIIKPFDTQGVLEKVADVMNRPRAQVVGAAPAAAPRPPAPQAAPPAAAAPPAPPRPPAAAAPPPAAPPPAAATPAAAAAAAAAGAAGMRSMKQTMAYGPPQVGARPPGAPPAAVPSPGAPPGPSRPITTPIAVVPPSSPPPAAAKPAPAAAPPAATPVRSAAAAATSSNGDLAAKLGSLGLDAGQVQAVLALSREVVERVVWEVVPDLAEAIIREEIKRLTAD